MGNNQNKSNATVAQNERAPAAAEEAPTENAQSLGPSDHTLLDSNVHEENANVRALRESKSKKSVKKKPEQRSLISPDKFQKFLRCLKEFPFAINENLFKDLAENLKDVTFNKNDVILPKGEHGKGIYLVVDGFCTVNSASGDVIRFIEDEDFFGEVSSFYNKTCSATVICGKDKTELLWLPKDVLEQFMTGQVDIPLLQWFVKRRYLDLEGTSIQQDIIKEMLTNAVLKAPLFHEWSSDAIDCVIESVIDDKSVVLYSAGHELFACGEVDANGFLLLQGDIEILSGYQQSLEILSAGPTGLWFGDEQLFLATEREISAKAHSPCIIATFKRYHFKEIEKTFPTENAKLMDLSIRWKKRNENRDKSLHDKYAGQLGLEMTRLVLRRSPLFELIPPGMVYYLALNLTHRQLQREELVFAENEKHDKMFVVFTGVVTVESDTTVSTKRLEVSKVYYPTEDEPDDVIIRATEDCIIGMFDVKAFKYAHDLYPEAIIAWKNAVEFF